MDAYQNLLWDVIAYGWNKTDRTGTGTRSLFGRQIRFDLRTYFPLLTTKSVHFKSVVGELLWFLHPEDSGNLNSLTLKQQYGVSIWDEWGDDFGDLGPIYGVQWRSWPSYTGGEIDQLKNVIEEIKETPDSLERNQLTYLSVWTL